MSYQIKKILFYNLYADDNLYKNYIKYIKIRLYCYFLILMYAYNFIHSNETVEI